MAVEYQSYNLNNIAVLKQRLALLQPLLLLDTEVFVTNLFLYPKSIAYLCVPLAVLLPIDPSQNSPFLQHSMLSRSELTLQTPKCGNRSVPPNLARHASLGQFRIHKARSLARQLAKCLAASARIQPVLGQLICTLLRPSYSESNSVFRPIKPVLRPDSMMSCESSQDGSSLNL